MTEQDFDYDAYVAKLRTMRVEHLTADEYIERKMQQRYREFKRLGLIP